MKAILQKQWPELCIKGKDRIERTDIETVFTHKSIVYNIVYKLHISNNKSAHSTLYALWFIIVHTVSCVNQFYQSHSSHEVFSLLFLVLNIWETDLYVSFFITWLLLGGYFPYVPHLLYFVNTTCILSASLTNLTLANLTSM